MLAVGLFGSWRGCSLALLYSFFGRFDGCGINFVDLLYLLIIVTVSLTYLSILGVSCCAIPAGCDKEYFSAGELLPQADQG